MPGYFVKRPWTSQPPAGTPIDRSNPLCKGLVRAILPQKGVYAYNAATGRMLTQGGSGTPTFVATPLGIGRVSFCTNNAINTDYSDDEGISDYLAKEVSISAVFKVESAIVSGGTISGESASTSGDALSFVKGASFPNRFRFQCRQDFTGVLLDVDSPIITVGGLYHLIGTFNRNTTTSTFTVYRIDTGEIGTVEDTVTDTSKDLIDFTRLNWSNVDDATVALYQAWNRELSAAERQELIKNPWQIFQPRTVWYKIGAAAGGTVNEVTKTDTLSPTEYSFQLRQSYREQSDTTVILDATIELREANREGPETLAATDSAIATYVPAVTADFSDKVERLRDIKPLSIG